MWAELPDLCKRGILVGELADARAFQTFLKPCWRAKWYVYAKSPFAGPDQVLAYLARYTHRVAIANSRLLAFDAKRVSFQFKDYRNGAVKARALLGVTPPPTAPGEVATEQPTEEPPQPTPCTCCGGRMILIETFERGAAPKSWTCAPVAPRRDSS